MRTTRVRGDRVRNLAAVYAVRDWVSVWEAAWLAGISERAVRARIASGQILLVEPRVTRQLRITARSVSSLARSARTAYWLDALLAGRVEAPRAEEPWQTPPPLPPVRSN